LISPYSSSCSVSLEMSLPLGLLVAAIWCSLLCLPVKCADPSLNVPACSSQFNYGWSSNSKGQTPCQVAGYLGSVCSDDNSFSIGPINGQQDYGLSLQQQNNCSCSSVFYSALSACAACQGASYENWAQWTFNCTTVYTIFPNPIPSGTAVPNWAYQNISGNATFNATLAQLAGDLPESSAPPSPTSTTATETSTSAAATSSNANGNNKNKTDHAGVIAGSVVGGLAFLSVMAILVALFIRHRGRSRSNPRSSSSPVLPDDDHDQMAMATPTPFLIYPSSPPPKLYNPSDPSTFPSQNTLTTQFTGSTRPTSHYHSVIQSDTSIYNGIAEI
jgi:hypothetical protein